MQNIEVDEVINKIICAIDTNDIINAKSIIEKLDSKLIIKLGMEFFYANTYEGIKSIKELKSDRKIFLDLKYHDIPNTVSEAINSTMINVVPHMMTLHASGGKKMILEAVKTVSEISSFKKIDKPIVLAVTVLTSLSIDDLLSMGWSSSLNEQVYKLASIAIDAGCDGLVCSALELEFLRKKLGDKVILVTPGIRPEWSRKNDQERIVTPSQAISLGASYLVIGRPITNAKDPKLALEMIINEIAGKYIGA